MLAKSMRTKSDPVAERPEDATMTAWQHAEHVKPARTRRSKSRWLADIRTNEMQNK